MKDDEDDKEEESKIALIPGHMENDNSQEFQKYKDLYQKALIKNMQIVLNDRKGKYENRCSTFFMSGHVGLHTILVLD